MQGAAIGQGADQIAGLGGYDTDFTSMGAMGGFGARIPGVKQLLNRYGNRAFGKGTNIGSTASRLATNPMGSYLGQPGGATTGSTIKNYLGFGGSKAQNIAAGIGWGGVAAGGINQFAQQRGSQAALAQADQIANRLGFENIDQFIASPYGQFIAGNNQGGILGGIQRGWGALPTEAKWRLGLGGAGLLGGLGTMAFTDQDALGAGMMGLGGASAMSGLGAFGGIPGSPQSIMAGASPAALENMQALYRDMPELAAQPMNDQSQVLKRMTEAMQQNELQRAGAPESFWNAKVVNGRRDYNQ
jgi:hypothetical protein